MRDSVFVSQVKKKIKEHHKKKRREVNANKKKGIKEKGPKDPGLPSQWPFKEEVRAMTSPLP